MDAMKRCPYCGEKILAIAVKCKHCQSQLAADSEARSPDQNRKSIAPALFGILIALVFFVWLLSYVSPDNKHEVAPVAKVESKIEPKIAPEEEKIDPAMLNNVEALDKQYGIAAAIQCASDADDYLRTASRYAFKWDDIAFFDTKFDRYRKSLVAPGVLTSVSQKVALQNGMGAYERISLFCNYDVQTKKTLGFGINEPPPRVRVTTTRGK